MPRYAVTSFVPDSKYHCFHWPERGPVDRATVLRGMPEPEMMKVLSLPCRHPANLHFQSHSRWAVLEIADENFVEQRPGYVDFQRGTVVFNGSP